MKRIILATTLFIGCVCYVNAQSLPAYPSMDDALSKAKSSDFLKGLLKLYYNADVTKCTFSKKFFSNTENKEIDGYFGKYTSDRCASLFPISMPYDMCISYITVTTPKDAMGSIYEVPVGVKYTRLKNDVLTNQWEFYNVELGSPRVKGGMATDNKAKIALLIEGIKKFPFNKGALYGSASDIGFEGSVEAIKEFARIDSIYSTGEKIENAKEQTWFFDIKGLLYSSNTGDIIDDASLSDNYVVKATLSVIQDAGKWKINDLMIRDNFSSEKSKEKYNGPILACFYQSSFDKIYKHKSYYEFPPESEQALKLKAKQLQSAIQNLTYNQDTDLKVLIQFFDPQNSPEKQALELFKIFKEVKDKQCTLDKTEVYGSYYGKPGSGTTENSINLDVYYKRESCLVKPELKDQYKAAGMNSKIIKAGAEIYSRTLFSDNKVKLVIRDNGIFLISVPALKEPIPF